MEPGEIAYISGEYKGKTGVGTFTFVDGVEFAALKGRVDVETDVNGKGIKRVLVAQPSSPGTAAGEGVFFTKVVSGQVELFYRYASDGAEIQLTSGGYINTPALVGPYYMNEQTAPATLANQGAFYTKDVGGITEVFYRYSSNGVELQITSNGALNVVGSGQIMPLIDVAPDPVYPSINAELGSAGYQVYAIQLNNGAYHGLTGLITLPDMLSTYQLVLEMAQSTTEIGKYVRMMVMMTAIQVGENPVNPAYDVNAAESILCRNDSNMQIVEHASFRFPAALMHNNNQLVRVRILRDGAGIGGTDDHTGNTYLYNAYFRRV